MTISIRRRRGLRSAFALGLAAALALPGAPARADMDQYRGYIACAAYHHFAASLLQVVDKKRYKAETKAHEESSKLNMEIASSMLDPYHVPVAQVRADTLAFTQQLLDRYARTNSHEEIMIEAAQTCPTFSFP